MIDLSESNVSIRRSVKEDDEGATDRRLPCPNRRHSLGLDRKICLALLYNVQHYTEEEKLGGLNIAWETRQSCCGCRALCIIQLPGIITWLFQVNLGTRGGVGRKSS
jgi:hypothetical protein